jgi:hypothetical protein
VNPIGLARLLLTSLLISAAFGLAVVGLGVVVVVADASRHDDDWDGLGYVIGPMLSLAGLVWSTVPVVLAVLLRRGTATFRRTADPRALQESARHSAATAAAVLGVLVNQVLTGSARATTLAIPLAVDALVLVLALVLVRHADDRAM